MMNSSLHKALSNSLLDERPLIATEEILALLEAKNAAQDFRVREISFSELKDWQFEGEGHSLVHRKGAFFALRGIRAESNFGGEKAFEQIIIDQPEIGILGIITRIVDGKLLFLMQFKFEPGNIRPYQLAPTFQATKSNYSRAHEGKLPDYASYFLDDLPRYEILADQLQSEQGSRFLKKRNRNVVIRVDEAPEQKANFYWLSLAQLKALSAYDNVLNMDARSVLACLPLDFFTDFPAEVLHDSFYRELASGFSATSLPYFSLEHILDWLGKLKQNYFMRTDFKSLKSLEGWQRDDFSIYDSARRQFRVLALEVEIGSREIRLWGQPIVQPFGRELNAFFVRKINEVPHFLVQAKMECGNFDGFELGPTIQAVEEDASIPFMEYVSGIKKAQAKVHFSSLQSEEGGRFYHEENRYMLLELFDDFPLELPGAYTWMSLQQIHTLLKFNNYFNVQARSLLALLHFR